MTTYRLDEVDKFEDENSHEDLDKRCPSLMEASSLMNVILMLMVL